MEEAVSHWSGKSFKHGHIYIYIYMATCVKRLPTGFREPGVQMYKFYCAKHNQHAKHINTRGV